MAQPITGEYHVKCVRDGDQSRSKSPVLEKYNRIDNNGSETLVEVVVIAQKMETIRSKFVGGDHTRLTNSNRDNGAIVRISRMMGQCWRRRDQ
jgi:aminoglycoside N3'-acetyltransferase